MKKLLQTICGVIFLPVIFALTLVVLDEVGYKLGGRTYCLGLNRWIPIGIAAYAVGFVFLEKTSLGGIFRWNGIEALWRKAIGRKPHPQAPPSEVGDEPPPPQPPWALRMVPYCIPVYAIGGIVIIGMLSWLWKNDYPEILGFVMGFFYAHHLAWIGRDIRRNHPDIRVLGSVLTPAIVYFVNVEIMMAILAAMVRDLRWIAVNHKAFNRSVEMLDGIWHWLRGLL